MSDIRRTPSIINLMFKYVVSFEVLRERVAAVRHLAKTFEINVLCQLSEKTRIVGFHRSVNKRKDGNPTRKTCTE